jgi:hypothetical protein
MELFTPTGKLKKVFLHLEMFDVRTTGDTAYIDTMVKFLPHTRVNSAEYRCTHVDACVAKT